MGGCGDARDFTKFQAKIAAQGQPWTSCSKFFDALHSDLFEISFNNYESSLHLSTGNTGSKALKGDNKSYNIHHNIEANQV